MSDTVDYFHSHAVEAALKARRMTHGRMRNKQRTVTRVYHLLAKSAAAENFHISGCTAEPVSREKISERV